MAVVQNIKLGNKKSIELSGCERSAIAGYQIFKNATKGICKLSGTERGDLM